MRLPSAYASAHPSDAPPSAAGTTEPPSLTWRSPNEPKGRSQAGTSKPGPSGANAASAGLAAAQTPPTKADDKKMEDKKDTSMKKAPHHTAVGTVKTAGPDNLVVAGKSKGKETEWTFALNDKTKVKKAGKEVMAKDLAAGDKVTVRYMDEGGKMTAMTVSAS